MSNRILLMAAAIGLTTAAMPAMAGYKWIKSEKDYVAQLGGKKFGTDAGWFISTADGKIKGKVGKQKMRGAWKWQGRYFCRNVVIGDRELGTDCQKIEYDGTNVRLTRKKGRGDVVVYEPK